MGELAKIKPLTDLDRINAAVAVRDPSKIAWPATLPIELALRTASPADLREHYGLTDDEWYAITHNEVFIAELGATADLMKKEGMTFKMKARLQAEAMLETSWRLTHAPNDEVSPAVKADLIKTTFRVAGFDNKEAAAGAGGNTLQIQINLGG